MDLEAVGLEAGSGLTDDERLAARAARRLAAPGAWLEPAGGHYRLHGGPDRRRRPALTLDEAAFRLLLRTPGLKPRPSGGYALREGVRTAAAPPPGRPGVVEGERAVMGADGALRTRRVNLGESPLAWLARRKGPDGSPWLTPAEVMAAERLRLDVERAGVIGRLTMSWDAGPRAGPGAPRLDPAERALAAKARVASALAVVGPGLAEMLERVCVQGSALEAAERELSLPRRAGKAVLKLGLQRLAAHYRLGC